LIHSAVDITAASLISAGAIAGAIIGSRLLNRLPVAWLRWSFITFLLLTAAHMLVSVPEPPHAQAFLPVVAVGYLLLGILTGVASGLFGIGGAIISVPLLGSIFALSDVVAKGTALLVSIPTSVVGTISNRRGSNPVDVRAGLILGVTAAATSVPAVYAAFALPPKISAVTFAALLIAIAIRLGIKKPATDPRPSRYHPDKRSPHMRIDHNDTAVVVIDPQNDVLSPRGKNWDSVGASVTENNTVAHLLEVFSAAKASDLDVFISPHYFYPTDETWLFNGPLELDEFRTNTFARAGALSLDGFIGSGADWLEDFKPFIEDGKTIVATPTKCGARKATISSCNCESAPFPR
jgi:uncharacterized membrane protein YfcA